VSNLSLTRQLNLLAGSLALDEQFRQDFMRDRVEAIRHFNNDFAPRNRQKLLEFSDSELKLIAALSATTLEEFLSLVATITSSADSRFLTKVESGRRDYILPSSLLEPLEISNTLAS